MMQVARALGRPLPYFGQRTLTGSGAFTLFLASLAIYLCARWVLLRAANSSAGWSLIVVACTFVPAVTFRHIRYAAIPSLLLPLLRGIAMVVLAQMIFDGFAVATGMIAGNGGLDQVFLLGGTLVATAAGILAFWIPSFALPLLFHYVCYRYQIGVMTGIAISETDYLSMLDIAVFVTIASLLIVTCTGVRQHAAASEDDARLTLRHEACLFVWMCSVGAHLGNYLISGWTKIRAGGGDPFYWLLHNPTQTSILIGLERGDNPLSTWPFLVQLSWDGIVAGGIVLNAIVLGVQLFSPVAILNRRWLIITVVLLDLFHIGVYLTLGALFFFWIAVNTLVCVSACCMTDRDFTWSARMVGLAAALLGHLAFYTSHLGWLDGAKLASPRFFAETRDGRDVEIPSVYFGLFSYSIAQAILYTPNDFFPVRVGGNAYNPRDFQDARSCGPARAERTTSDVSLAAIENMVRTTDAVMRRNDWLKSWNLFYAYPHHMVANPFMFTNFNGLSMADITRYRYEVDAVCLGLANGRLTRDVRDRFRHVIDVAR